MSRVSNPLVIIVALASALPSYAQLDVLGDRFETEGLAFCELTDGNLAITWWADSVPAQENWLRLYSADGNPVTDPILVYSDPDDSPAVGPQLCCKPSGGLVVIYGVPSPLFAMNSLEAGSFDNSGAPVGETVEVTAESPFNNPRPPVCYEGGFLAHWQQDTGMGLDPTHYRVRRFGADGLPAGAEFRVDKKRSSFEPASGLAARPDGSFTVVWAGPLEGTITAQEYDASDVKRGPEISVLNLGNSETFQEIDVAINGAGERMFVWTENAFPEIYGRGFDSGGVPLAPPFEVDGNPSLQARASHVVARPNGEFIVTWTAWATDVISVRTFTTDGQPAGNGLIIEPEGAYPYRTQLVPPSGLEFAASFLATPQSGQKVPFIRYLSAGLVFSDGFETGDTSAWSSIVP